MRINRWILTVLTVFLLIQAVGIFSWIMESADTWRCSAPTAVALYSLFFSMSFFSLFASGYLSCRFNSYMNTWIRHVKIMHGPLFNPVYFTWLYERDMRRWAAWMTLISSIMTPIFGLWLFFFFLSLTNVEISFANSEFGFLVACVYLVLLALSWYKGFWKPRTGKVKYSIEELSYEAEEGDSYYFPPKPA